MQTMTPAAQHGDSRGDAETHRRRRQELEAFWKIVAAVRSLSLPADRRVVSHATKVTPARDRILGPATSVLLHPVGVILALPTAHPWEVNLVFSSTAPTFFGGG